MSRIHVYNGKYLFFGSMIFFLLIQCSLITCIKPTKANEKEGKAKEFAKITKERATDIPSMFNDKKSFRKESILLYERYKKNKDPCYTEAMEQLEAKCSRMNPTTKIMIAAHLMNCQYVSAGRTTHWFNETCSNKEECLDKVDNYFKDLGSDNYNIEMIALYFTHVDIICYYMNRVDWNKRYYLQLEQISALSEEIWNQLGTVQQQNYDLLTKQNNSYNVLHTLSSVTSNSYKYIKNASGNLLYTLSNMNISAANTKNLLLETLGVIFNVFYRLEQLVRVGLWNIHKFGGILFFTLLSLYTLFLTKITNTKYTRTKLMILLWLLFVLDASMVFFVINKQPIKHLNKYVMLVRAFCVVAINLGWVLLSYYIPRWIPLSNNMDISHLIHNMSSRFHHYDHDSVQQSSDVIADIRKAQRKTLSILNDARKRTNRKHSPSINSINANLFNNDVFNDDSDSDISDEHFVTGMEQLPKPMSSIVSSVEHPSLLSTSAKYFHNVVDSINLVSPARRIIGAFHPSFATSTVIRESNNRKPLSPRVLKRSTSASASTSNSNSINNVNSNVEGTFNANSPFTFKVPIKNVLPNNNIDDHVASTAASFYGNKVTNTQAKVQSPVGEKVESSNKRELKRKNSGRKTTAGRRAAKNEDHIDSDAAPIETEDSSEVATKKRGRKAATTGGKQKSKIPVAVADSAAHPNKAATTTTAGRRNTRRSKETSTE